MFTELIYQRALLSNHSDHLVGLWGVCSTCGERIPLSSQCVKEELVRVDSDVLLFEVGRCPRPGCGALNERFLGTVSLN